MIARPLISFLPVALSINEKITQGFYNRSIRRIAAKNPKKQPLGTNFRNIAIVRFDGLGDAVLTTPMIRELKRSFPGAKITGVFDPGPAKLLRMCRYLDRVLSPGSDSDTWLPGPFARMKSLRRFYEESLASEEFDLVLVPRFGPDQRGGLYLASLLGPDRVVAYRSTGILPNVFEHLISTSGEVKHEVERNLDCVRFLGGTVESTELSLEPNDEDKATAARLLAEVDPSKQLIILGVGATGGKRLWPLENYAELVNQIAGRLDVMVGIVAGPSEQPLVDRLSTLINAPQIPLKGLSTGEIFAVMARASVFVGNDSGPGHIAAAAGIPTITISPHWVGGPGESKNSPQRFSPYGKQSVLVQPSAPLPGCEQGCAVPFAHCIKLVTVNMVLDKLAPILNAELVTPR